MEPAPYFHEVAEGPKGVQAVWLTGSDGVRIRAAFWPCADAKGTVLLFPGRTEYVEKYARPAVDYAARGFALLAIDWRGQGIADRLVPDRRVGYVERFTDYQTDVAAVLEALPALSVPEPLYLVGHSMGGAIGLRALIEGLPVKAAAFSGPMWGIALPPAMRPFAWLISSAARTIGLGNRFAPGTDPVTYVLAAEFADNTLTRDRDFWDYMRRQLQAHPDLALGGPSLHWVNEALREMALLNTHPLPEVPVQVHMGANERIVDPPALERLTKRWDSADWITYPDAEHELMMEVESVRTAFFDRTAALFSTHSAG